MSREFSISCLVCLIIGLGLGWKWHGALSKPEEVAAPAVSEAKDNTRVERVVITKVQKDGSKVIEEHTSEQRAVASKAVVPVAKPQPKNKLDVRIRDKADLGLGKSPVYELGYERKVADKVWVGTSVSTEKEVSVSIGVEF